MGEPKIARERAERKLSTLHRKSPEWMQGDALKGIGWALLELADAVRDAARELKPVPLEPVETRVVYMSPESLMRAVRRRKRL